MSDERRILRWAVPVDDQWHRIEFDGRIVHVDCRDPRLVEFWTINEIEVPGTHLVADWYERPSMPRRAEFRVYGTGQPIEASDNRASYVGSTVAPGGALVWHLFRRAVVR